MIGNGLKFTTATQGDEFAYRTLYSGMVALDVALNTLLGGIAPEPATEAKDSP